MIFLEIHFPGQQSTYPFSPVAHNIIHHKWHTMPALRLKVKALKTKGNSLSIRQLDKCQGNAAI